MGYVLHLRQFPRHAPGRQRGVAAVEFAFIMIAFVTLLLGCIEFGRVLFTWNSMAEATRWGARLAVVCDVNDSTIKEKMRLIVPQLTDGQINIAYSPAGCGWGNCASVNVGITGATITPIIPLLGLTLTVPPFSTSLLRENMKSTVDGESNPVCQ